ncbi:MAG TPA: glycosyltransferase [Candidatus Dormibacteraeota bacterium]|nr:glycosyltransferase [Candidatus Dormibacteraeota bacterium]
MLLHAALFFAALSLAITIVAFFPGAIRARFWISLPLLALLVVLVTWNASIIAADRDYEIQLAVITVVATLLTRLAMRAWSWLGAALFAAATLASLGYLLYAASITYAVGSDAVYLVASSLLLVLEIAALGLSLSYLFEIVDTVSRRTEPVHKSDPNFLPKIAVQLPAYNEPLEVMGETLKALAALDYPDLIVQVVDNNTPDRQNWEALKAECEKLGPRFQFIHLENWPGFKAGALNEATRRLPKEVEIIAVVDSDYVVRPDWLRSVVGHFADPNVAFVQTPQNYRDWDDDQYLRGLYYSYRYFFEITMPSRGHRNAIIFAGTMGLVRRSALEEIGGWNPDIVTEDAEASLRILASGHSGVYVNRAYGHGLMPLSFDGLKKQRFRWALGGVQILRLHWRRLLIPGQGGNLTVSQRVSYLLGNVQWFGDALMFCFTILLLLTALSTALHHQLPIRRMTGVALGLPLAFLAGGLLRAVWAMKLQTRCTWRDAVSGLRVWFALSWVVTLACIRGLIRFHTTFLRTPKEKEGEKSIVTALRSAQIETLLAVTGLAAAIVMVVRAPSISTGALAILLLFQAAIYANAPWAGAAAEGIHLTPMRRAYRRSAQSTGGRPGLGAQTLAVPVALAVVGLVVMLLVSLATPPAPPEPATPAPAEQAAAPARPLTQTSPSASASPSSSASPVSSPSASPSASASPKH